ARMGLNTGEVVVGTIRDDLRMDYTAHGHAVGLAARMEQVAAPGTVYVSEHTARLVEGFFTLRDHGTPPMKGVSTPVRVFELGGSAPFGRASTPPARGGSRGWWDGTRSSPGWTASSPGRSSRTGKSWVWSATPVSGRAGSASSSSIAAARAGSPCRRATARRTARQFPCS